MRKQLDTSNKLGNTGMNTISGGGDSTFYSPFSPSYVRGIGMQADEDTRANPPKPPDLDQATALAVAGLLVRKKWKACHDLCQRQIAYIAQKGGKVAVIGGKNKAGKNRPNPETFGQALTKIADYCQSLMLRHKMPMRRAVLSDAKAIRARGTFKPGSYTSEELVVSLWEDVVKSALATEGNAKLPFAAYSEMPVVTCPGAGGVAYGVLTADQLGAAKTSTRVRVDTQDGCAAWCYSYKAFNKPTKLSRLWTMTLGSAVSPEYHAMLVAQQMLELYRKKRRGKAPPTKILRLFVDGDFRDQRRVRAWMDACKYLYDQSNGNIVVYGYSKSWDQFLSLARKGYQWPQNYVLNISSGSRHGPQKEAAMMRLPISRGRFVAVPVLERLVLRALGQQKGRRTFMAFQRQTAQINKGTKKYVAALAALLEKVRKADPELYRAWAEYEQRNKTLKKDPRVLKKLNAVSGQDLTVGFAQQQARAALLRILDAPVRAGARRNFTCPIDCGTCPFGPLGGARGAEKLLLDAMNLDRVATAAETRSAVAKTKKAKEREDRKAVHACGNPLLRADINIGIH